MTVVEVDHLHKRYGSTVAVDEVSFGVGTTNREVARRLFISEATVKTHLLHPYAKLDVRDRAAAVAAGYEAGLLG